MSRNRNIIYVVGFWELIFFFHGKICDSCIDCQGDTDKTQHLRGKIFASDNDVIYIAVKQYFYQEALEMRQKWDQGDRTS